MSLKSVPPSDNNGQAQPEPAMEQVSMTFNCPVGFKPAMFAIVAMDAEGKTFTNAPMEQPNIMLHLASSLMTFCSQQAVRWIQQKQAMDRAIVVARGQLPPFDPSKN